MQRNRLYKDGKLNEAAEELKSYCTLLHEAQELKAKANEYRERYGLNAQAYDGVYVENGSKKDTMVETVLQWLELEKLAEDKRLKAENVLWLIRDKLSKLPTSEKNVLELYYIKGYNNEQVSNELCYSFYYIKDLKQKALKMFALL